MRFSVLDHLYVEHWSPVLTQVTVCSVLPGKLGSLSLTLRSPEFMSTINYMCVCGKMPSLWVCFFICKKDTLMTSLLTTIFSLLQSGWKGQVR